MEFAVDEVDDAVRVFDRAADDLLRARRSSWRSRLEALVHLGRTNAVLDAVLQPLREMDVDAEGWWKARNTGDNWAVHGGSGPLSLPRESDRAAALMLQMVEAFADHGTKVERAILGIVGVRAGGDFDIRTQKTSDELLTPLRAYVDERLGRLRRQFAPKSAEEALARRFTLDEVEHADEAFGAAAAKLRHATDDLWDTRLRRLLHLCRTDAVLDDVLRPLRSADLDVRAWWQARRDGHTPGTLRGKKRLEPVPVHPDEAAALMVKLFELFEAEELSYRQVVGPLIGTAGDDRLFEEFVEPLQSYVTRQLRALRSAAQATLPPPVSVVNNYHGNVGIAAPGGTFDRSRITVHQSTTYHATSELGRELMSLTELLASVETNRHAEVQAALATLADGADRGGRKSSELVTAAETVAEAHESLGARLRAIAQRWSGKLGGALVAGAATEAGKQAVLHQERVLQAISTALGGPAQ